MKNLSISGRMACAFGFVLLLLIASSATSILSNIGLSDAAADITGRRLSMLGAANDSTVSVLQSARHTRNMLIVDRDKVPAEVVSARKQQQARAALIEAMRKGVMSEEGRQRLVTIEKLEVSYLAPEQKYLQMIETDQRDEARDYLIATMRPAQLELLTAIEDFARFQKAGMTSAAEKIQSEASSARWLVTGTALASLVLAVIAGAALSRSIVRPIGRAVEIAETVARGDLTSRIEAGRGDETGRLLAALSRMNTNLASVVAEVRSGSESIATGSKEIAIGNSDLSQRTEEQASSLEQTAASMEQLHGTVRQSAETAREASRLAEGASLVAADGGSVVARFVGTMSAISNSSKRIADIVGVIDGIAFQTNILALNAAVEAARAGEQGRGFAVVASEVRTLAQRSANAAKEIKVLIQDSADKVEAGTVLVTEAGAKMGDLVGQVQRVSSMISEISAAASEQTTGISQVNEAVTQLDRVTQQNAALVEESAAAAISLKQQSERLVTAVAQFRTDPAAIAA